MLTCKGLCQSLIFSCVPVYLSHLLETVNAYVHSCQIQRERYNMLDRAYPQSPMLLAQNKVFAVANGLGHLGPISAILLLCDLMRTSCSPIAIESYHRLNSLCFVHQQHPPKQTVPTCSVTLFEMSYQALCLAESGVNFKDGKSR